MTTLTAFPFNIGPLNNITPFTYRDGTTYVEVLYKLRDYINLTLRPEFDAEMTRIIAEFQTGVANAEAWQTSTEAAHAAAYALFTTNTNNAITAFENSINTQISTFEGSTNTAITAFEANVNGQITTFEAVVNAQYAIINNKSGPIDIQRHTVTAPYLVAIDPMWPTNQPVMFSLKQDATGGHPITLGTNVHGFLGASLAPLGLTEFTLIPDGTGNWNIANTQKDPIVLKLASDGSDVGVAFQAALDGLNSGDYMISPAGKTYSVNQQLNLNGKSNITLDFNGSTISSPNVSTVFNITGTRTSAITTVTSTIVKGSRQVGVASVAGLNPGDMISFYSDTESFNPERPEYVKGEIAYIDSIAGNTLTLETPIWDDYSIAGKTVTVDKFTPMKNVRIKNLRILGGGAGKTQFGLSLAFFDQVFVEGCVIEATETCGIAAQLGMGAYFRNNTVSKCNATGTGYGLMVQGVDVAEITGNRGRNNRHSIDVSGSNYVVPSRRVLISNNTTSNDSSAGISTHGDCDFTVISHNRVLGCGGGIIVRGSNSIVDGNMIKGNRTSTESYTHGILIGDSVPHIAGVGLGGKNLTLINNTVDMTASTSGTTNAVIAWAALDKALIFGNKFKSPDVGLNLLGNYSADLVIEDNDIEITGAGIYAILLAPTNVADGNNQKRVKLTNNRVNGGASTTSAIRFNGNLTNATPSDAIIIEGNIIRTFTTRGVDLGFTGYFNRVRVQNNIFPDAASTAGNSVVVNQPNMAMAPVIIGNSYTGSRGGFVGVQSSVPASGTYNTGDIVINSNPAQAGSAGSMYVIWGWVCLTTGTPGTWVPMRVLTGN